jgi:GR25 family glycosyltransferase involved in LPS biosynthesis
MTSYQVYCFSYKNESRYNEMNTRFKSLDIDIEWIEAVGPEDPRIVDAVPKRANPKGDGCMYSHLRTLETFLKSTNEYAIVCEDDVYIRKSFKKDIHTAIDAMKRLDLHVLLLSYLTSYIPVQTFVQYHTPLETPFTFLNVFEETWGTQMYMVNRAGAQEIIDKFSDVKKVESYTCFAADWTITKLSKKACIYPMLGVEKVYERNNDTPDRIFHLRSEQINYNPNDYV